MVESSFTNKELWVQVLLQSFNFQIWHPKSSMTFIQLQNIYINDIYATTEYRCDMMKTQSQFHDIDKYSK